MTRLLEAIVGAYIRDYRGSARDEMNFFRDQASLPAAIRNAALCTAPAGKRHPHQHRIRQTALKMAERRLQSASASLKGATDFSELHAIVENKLVSIFGIGPLTIYDIAHRIGAYLGEEPALVYLHAGTGVGAKALGLTGKTIRSDQLPPPFLRLRPAEIEDCLCIYKDDLLERAFARRSQTKRVCASRTT